MRPARLALLLLLVIALNACRPQPFQPVSPTPLPFLSATLTKVPPPPSSAATKPLESTSTLPAPSTTASPSPPETPTTRSTPTSHFQPYNQLDQLDYSPWELVLALAWSPDGSTLAVAAGESLHLYDAATLQERLSLNAGVWSTSLAFSPDGALLASGGRDGRLRLWDTTGGALQRSLSAHKKGVNSVAFSPDGAWLASGGNDAVARLWEVSSGKRLGQLIGGTFAVPAVLFSRDGASLAIVNGPLVRLRDAKTTRFVQTFRGENTFYSLALSPDGRTLAGGDSAGEVYLWDFSSGAQLHILTDPALPPGSPLLVWSVAFSPDGLSLAASGSDGRLRVWEASSGSLLASWAAHSRPVTSLAFSPDGRVLTSGSLDGSVRFWQVK